MAGLKDLDWGAPMTESSVVVNTALSAYALVVTDWAYQLDTPTWVPLAVGVAGAVGFTAAVKAEADELGHRRLPWGTSVARSAACLLAGGWTSFALAAQDPFTWAVGTPLAGLAVAMLSGVGALKVRRKVISREKTLVAEANVGRAKGQEWSDLILRVCGVKEVETVGIEPWKVGKGVNVELRMPPGGTTWRDIASRADSMASDLNLPKGCGVEVFPGVTRGTAILRVSQENSLNEERDLPHDATPLSFRDDFSIGFHRDGSEAMVNMRQNSGLLVGQKRTGKTNELQVFLSRFARMTDLLIWVIDFNGGGVALPWVKAWDEAGRPGRPPIDWVASTHDEALAMVEMAVRIAKARKIQYQDLMISHDTDLLPISPDVPGIMLVTDEGAEILTGSDNREVAKAYVEVLRIAGAVAVNELTCALRSTADTLGDPMIKSQSNLRVGMKMADEAEIAYMFGWANVVSPEDMPDQGYGAYQNGEAKPSIFKGYRVKPSTIGKLALDVVNLRPELDSVSLACDEGDVYATRWARADHLFGRGPRPTPATPAPASPAAPWGPPKSPAEAADALARAMAAAPAGPLPAAIETPPAEAAPASARDFVFGLVKASGQRGIKPSEVEQGLADAGFPSVHRVTLSRWLSSDDRIWRPTGHSRYVVKPETTA